MTVDEIGQSLIVLLPNVDGTVGEIEVFTTAGVVVLNQAFQATFATNTETKPMKPTILNLSENMIDNMLIVKPPKEVLRRIMEEQSKDALKFTELDKNALEVKVWKDVYAKYDELNINTLNDENLTNAFDDLLSAMFSVGYNSNTKVYVFDKNTYWQVNRNVLHNTTILLGKDRGYNITIIQDGSKADFQTQETTTNNIFIKQTK
jgi:hypothetical protein